MYPQFLGENHRNDHQMLEHMEKNEYPPMVRGMIMAGRKLQRMALSAISPQLIDKNYRGPEPKIDHTLDLVKRHFADPSKSDSPIIIFSTRAINIAIFI